jgi:hypothetical protein
MSTVVNMGLITLRMSPPAVTVPLISARHSLLVVIGFLTIQPMLFYDF